MHCAKVTHLWVPFDFTVSWFHPTNNELHSLRGQSVEPLWEQQQLVSCDELGPAFIYEFHQDTPQTPVVFLLAHLQHLNPKEQQRQGIQKGSHLTLHTAGVLLI